MHFVDVLGLVFFSCAMLAFSTFLISFHCWCFIFVCFVCLLSWTYVGSMTVSSENCSGCSETTQQSSMTFDNRDSLLWTVKRKWQRKEKEKWTKAKNWIVGLLHGGNFYVFILHFNTTMWTLLHQSIHCCQFPHTCLFQQVL